MKNLLLDIFLVLMILLIGSNILTPHNMSEEQFQTEMQTFNQDVSSGALEEHYQLSKEVTQNKMSQFVEGVSEVSRDGIRLVVETFAKAFYGF